MKSSQVHAHQGIAQDDRDTMTPSVDQPAIRSRCWLLCCILVPLNLLWSFWTLSVNPAGPWFDESPLLANVIVILFLLALANTFLGRYRASWKLTGSEMLLIYSVLAVSTAIGGSCYFQGLGVTIAYPYWFGGLGRSGPPGSVTPSDWSVLRHLPDWLVVSDKIALKGFWEGASTFYSVRTVWAWTVPILAWAGFIILIFFASMCLNILVRKEWIYEQRLTFPIIQLPLEMSRSRSTLLQSRLFWLGCVLAASTQILNGLAYFTPSLPSLPTKFQSIQYLFPASPWNAMDNLTISLHPMMIGLGYLLPQDILFSSWFFHLFWQLQRVVSAAMGFTPTQQANNLPGIHNQAFGGVLAISGFLVWSMRSHFKQAVLNMIRTRKVSDGIDHTEAFSKSFALLGFLLSFLLIICFHLSSGMTWVTALGITLLLFLSLLTITRIRAESGGPLLDMVGFFNPAVTLTRLFGTASFPARDLSLMALNSWHTEFGYNQPMPYGLEALRTAPDVKRSQRTFFFATMVAAIVGMLGTAFIEMNYAYRQGEASGFIKYNWAQTATWARLDTWLDTSTAWSPISFLATGFGAMSTSILTLVRSRFIGFPLHPIPYVVTAGAGTYVGFFWLPFLIVWIIKVIILRYSGLSGYRVFLPFFYGLIIGEMTGGMLWPLYGMLTGTRCYSFFGT